VTGFAVFDVETTGLWADGTDRIVEIAIVHVDLDGRVTDRWETLVNPERDLGPQSLHGIRSLDVLDAPRFATIAPTLVELFADRVLVAHNAEFDLRFLLAELERAGLPLWSRPAHLCTMRLAREFLPGSGRALADCCDAFDIPLDGAHRAAVDALATARLLAAYLQTAPEDARWRDALTAASAFSWPAVTHESALAKPRPIVLEELTAASFLERISIRMPDVSGPAEHSDYLAMLDRALLDRHISAHEAGALVACAERLGIGRSVIETLHREYFDALVRIAWEDGELTDAELADLVAVADLLALPTAAIEDAISARASAAAPWASPEAFALAPGDVVVLTGEMSRPRMTIEAEIAAHGLLPASAVTKKARLVIAADPDSLSGKARKARDYGIALVDEFTGMELVRAV